MYPPASLHSAKPDLFVDEQATSTEAICFFEEADHHHERMHECIHTRVGRAASANREKEAQRVATQRSFANLPRAAHISTQVVKEQASGEGAGKWVSGATSPRCSSCTTPALHIPRRSTSCCCCCLRGRTRRRATACRQTSRAQWCVLHIRTTNWRLYRGIGKCAPLTYGGRQPVQQPPRCMFPASARVTGALQTATGAAHAGRDRLLSPMVSMAVRRDKRKRSHCLVSSPLRVVQASLNRNGCSQASKLPEATWCRIQDMIANAKNLGDMCAAARFCETCDQIG